MSVQRPPVLDLQELLVACSPHESRTNYRVILQLSERYGRQHTLGAVHYAQLHGLLDREAHLTYDGRRWLAVRALREAAA